MNMYEWEKARIENITFLDTIDFTQFMSKEDNVLSVGDIYNAVEDYYFEHPELLPPSLKGFVFNYISVEGLSEYLAKRYKVNSHWETVDFYYIDNPNLS